MAAQEDTRLEQEPTDVAKIRCPCSWPDCTRELHFMTSASNPMCMEKKDLKKIVQEEFGWEITAGDQLFLCPVHSAVSRH